MLKQPYKSQTTRAARETRRNIWDVCEKIEKTDTNKSQDPRPRLQVQVKESYKSKQKEVFKVLQLEVTRGPQTRVGNNPENGYSKEGYVLQLRDVLNCPEPNEAADLPLAGDVLNIDTHKPPTSHPPLPTRTSHSWPYPAKFSAEFFLRKSFLFPSFIFYFKMTTLSRFTLAIRYRPILIQFVITRRALGSQKDPRS